MFTTAITVAVEDLREHSRAFSTATMSTFPAASTTVASSTPNSTTSAAGVKPVIPVSQTSVIAVTTPAGGKNTVGPTVPSTSHNSALTVASQSIKRTASTATAAQLPPAPVAASPQQKRAAPPPQPSPTHALKQTASVGSPKGPGPVAWSVLQAKIYAPNESAHVPPGDPGTWSVGEVCVWLAAKNLRKYTDAFSAHEIDGACLKMGLDDETLTTIGVAIPIHRRKLQMEARALFAAPGSDWCFIDDL
eukprot:m.286231 g.286231  ORF g.286231 m.286231 type:complete len:248 (+) comp54985_c0_seq11:416-1159(+)